MNLIKLPFEGAYLLDYHKHIDNRGAFVKNFHVKTFENLGLVSTFAESFWSTSHKDVLRGMHFQKPPNDHAKIVSCLKGTVLDVFVDLRINQPTFKQVAAVTLSENDPKAVYLPRGIAHGFLSLADSSLMHYMVETVHSPECDAGICWNSIDFDWGVTKPIISDRDSHFPALKEYQSEFK